MGMKINISCLKLVKERPSSLEVLNDNMWKTKSLPIMTSSTTIFNLMETLSLKPLLLMTLKIKISSRSKKSKQHIASNYLIYTLNRFTQRNIS